MKKDTLNKIFLISGIVSLIIGVVTIFVGTMDVSRIFIFLSVILNTVGFTLKKWRK